MTPDIFEQNANAFYMKVREILGQAERVHPDIPVSIIIALVAEHSLFVPEPETWTTELINAVHECRLQKMAALTHESAMNTRH